MDIMSNDDLHKEVRVTLVEKLKGTPLKWIGHPPLDELCRREIY